MFMICLLLSGCVSISDLETKEEQKTESQINSNSFYSTPEEVAEYLNIYGELPSNFITKKEAESLGWESEKGNLWEVTDKMSIGGDYFGNREKKLPTKSGRKWYECDVNYEGGFRGSERIVYSNDGLIYYTDDHYETFTQLY
jgi:guanyl-specific ribonuclease Sa